MPHRVRRFQRQVRTPRSARSVGTLAFAVMVACGGDTGSDASAVGPRSGGAAGGATEPNNASGRDTGRGGTAIAQAGSGPAAASGAGSGGTSPAAGGSTVGWPRGGSAAGPVGRGGAGGEGSMVTRGGRTNTTGGGGFAGAGAAVAGTPGAGGSTAATGGASGGGTCTAHPLGVEGCPCGHWVDVHDRGTEDRVAALDANTAGSVVVAGHTTNGPGMWVVKYDAAGTPLWDRTVPDQGTAPGLDGALDVALDSAGGVVLSGFASAERWLGRYDAAGTRSWTVAGGEPHDAIAIDATGSIVASASDLRITKYGPEGGEVWTEPSGLDPLPTNWTVAVAVDRDDNAIVAGSVRQDDGPIGVEDFRTDIWVRKLDASGSLLWTRQYDGGRDDWVYDVAVDGDNNVIVVGRSYLPGPDGTLGYQGWLRKYSSGGDALWTHFEANAGAREVGNQVATDANGNATVAWFELTQIDPDGNVIATSPCRADLVAIAPGQLVLAGTVERPSETFEPDADAWVGSHLYD